MKNLGIGDVLQKYDEVSCDNGKSWEAIADTNIGSKISNYVTSVKFRRPSNSICKVCAEDLILCIGLNWTPKQGNMMLQMDQGKDRKYVHIRSTDLYKIFSKDDARKIHEYCKKNDLYIKDTTTCVAEQAWVKHESTPSQDVDSWVEMYLKIKPRTERILSQKQQSMLGYEYLKVGVDTILATDEWYSHRSGKWTILGADSCVGQICRVADAFRRKVASAAAPEYRELVKGVDVFQKGDEYLNSEGKWITFSIPVSGMTVDSDGCRRSLSKDLPAGYRWLDVGEIAMEGDVHYFNTRFVPITVIIGQKINNPYTFARKAAQAAPVQYVNIETGDTLRAGDECKCITNEWSPVPKQYCGSVVTSSMKLYTDFRRPVTDAEPASKSGLYALLQEDESFTVKNTGVCLKVIVRAANGNQAIKYINDGIVKTVKQLLQEVRS
jgi:hypothetical protein